MPLRLEIARPAADDDRSKFRVVPVSEDCTGGGGGNGGISNTFISTLLFLFAHVPTRCISTGMLPKMLLVPTNVISAD